MTKYNYLEAVTADVKEYVKNEIDVNDYESREDLAEYLYDELFINDSVTGNASGSYYCNAWLAEEALCHNLDLLQEALEEFGCDVTYLEKGAESCDVTIRCYLLGQAIESALDQLSI